MKAKDSQQPAHASVPSGVAGFVRDVAGLLERHLGERLAGVYLIGSLAHGGYSARYSDIDVALIARAPLSTADLDPVRGRVALRSPDLAPRLSLFWSDETFSVGRFPPLDRIDYLDHGLPLLERRRILPERPTLVGVRAYLSADPLRNWAQQATRLSALQELPADDHKAYLRALLYPARFLYSWETGNVTSNDAAVAYIKTRDIEGLDAELIESALRCRNAGEDPSRLFPERHKLPGLVRACAERAGATSPL